MIGLDQPIRRKGIDVAVLADRLRLGGRDRLKLANRLGPFEHHEAIERRTLPGQVVVLIADLRPEVLTPEAFLHRFGDGGFESVPPFHVPGRQLLARGLASFFEVQIEARLVLAEADSGGGVGTTETFVAPVVPTGLLVYGYVS